VVPVPMRRIDAGIGWHRGDAAQELVAEHGPQGLQSCTAWQALVELATLPQIPVASVLTRTSPCWGRGIGASISSRPPLRITTAVIVIGNS